MIAVSEVKVFGSDSYEGVSQFLVECSDQGDLNQTVKSFEIDTCFDYTFFCKDSDNNYMVRWKNKAGDFSFCGSGAYALSEHLLKDNSDEKLILKSKDHVFRAFKVNGQISLEIRKKIARYVGHLDVGDIYYENSTGICLLRLKNPLDQFQNFTDFNVTDDFALDVHSLCVFYWNKELGRGDLRYFVPRYGRDEDYVTGSVHEVLTPLVAKLEGVNSQIWYQLSSLPGGVKTLNKHDRVLISKI